MQRNYINLQAYDIEEHLCTCGDDANSTKELKDILQCSSSKVKRCNSANYHVSPLQIEQCSSFGTATVPDSFSTVISDLHSNTETSFIPTTNIYNTGNHQVWYV